MTTDIDTTTWKRAIYIGPRDERDYALSYGMTGYYDTVHQTFIPDGQEGCYGVIEDCFYFPKY
jgi:hypothetical protein